MNSHILIARSVFLHCFLFVSTAFAQLPIIELSALSRQTAKAGSEFELQAPGGSRTDEVTELHFSHPEITAELLTDKPLPFSDSPQPKFGNFRVRIPETVAPGRYEVRALGRHGLSNPRAFVVHDFAADSTAAPSTDKSKPTPLPLNTVVNAKAGGAGVHYFSFRLDTNQRVRIDCIAAQIDSRMIPSLRLIGADGNTLQTRRGSDVVDPSLIVESDSGSGYVLAVHDAIYRAGIEYGYALTIQPQESAKSLVAPTNKSLPHQLSLQTSASASGIPSDLLELATLVEEVSDAKPIDIPCVLQSKFDSPQDKDVYQFAGTEGDRLTFDLFSQRLAQPTDCRMVLERAEPQANADPKWIQVFAVDDGPNLGNAAIQLAAKDPQTTVTLPKTTTYRLHVSDLDSGTALGATQDYVLRIQPAKPSFQLVAYRPFPSKDINASRPVGSSLFRDGTQAIYVFCKRMEGWTGAVKLTVEGLPTGVTCEPATLAANQNQTQLTLVASENAEKQTADIRITGKAKVGKEIQTNIADAATIHWGRGAGRAYIRSRRCTSLAIAVSDVDVSPISIKLGDGKPADIKKGESLTLPIKLVRREQSKDNCVLRARGLPPKVSAGDVTIAGDKTEGKLVLKVPTDAPVGTYSIWMQAETKIKWKANPQAMERAKAYRAHLQTILDDPAKADQKAEVEAAIKSADQRIANAKGSDTPQDLIIYPPSHHVTIRIVDPS